MIGGERSAGMLRALERGTHGESMRWQDLGGLVDTARQIVWIGQDLPDESARRLVASFVDELLALVGVLYELGWQDLLARLQVAFQGLGDPLDALRERRGSAAGDDLLNLSSELRDLAGVMLAGLAGPGPVSQVHGGSPSGSGGRTSPVEERAVHFGRGDVSVGMCRVDGKLRVRLAMREPAFGIPAGAAEQIGEALIGMAKLVRMDRPAPARSDGGVEAAVVGVAGGVGEDERDAVADEEGSAPDVGVDLQAAGLAVASGGADLLDEIVERGVDGPVGGAGVDEFEGHVSGPSGDPVGGVDGSVVVHPTRGAETGGGSTGVGRSPEEAVSGRARRVVEAAGTQGEQLDDEEDER